MHSKQDVNAMYAHDMKDNIMDKHKYYVFYASFTMTKEYEDFGDLSCYASFDVEKGHPKMQELYTDLITQRDYLLKDLPWVTDFLSEVVLVKYMGVKNDTQKLVSLFNNRNIDVMLKKIKKHEKTKTIKRMIGVINNG